MKMIRNYLSKRQSEVMTTVSSIGAILIAILANYLYKILFEEKDIARIHRIIIVVAFVAISIVLIYFLSCITNKFRLIIWPQNMDEYYMKHAFLDLRKLERKRLTSAQKELAIYTSNRITELLLRQVMKNLQLTIDCCYDFFESSFTDKSQLVNKIKFEATFMTRSYKDGKITIPFSANKEQRRPSSMLLREEKPDIYENTETAKVYKMKHPVMVLIENTSSEGEKYNELYQDQKQRIKSSVILPVLSHKNEILGTLVVHCDKEGFFEMNRYQFWNELLDMFAVELGYNKIFLDYLVSNQQELSKPF